MNWRSIGVLLSGVFTLTAASCAADPLESSSSRDEAPADGAWSLALEGEPLSVWTTAVVQETGAAEFGAVDAGNAGYAGVLLLEPAAELGLSLEVRAPLAEIAVLVPGVDPAQVYAELDGQPIALMADDRVEGAVLSLSAPASGVYALTLRSAVPMREVAVLALDAARDVPFAALAERGLPPGMLSLLQERAGEAGCPTTRWAGSVRDSQDWLARCAAAGGVPTSSSAPVAPPAAVDTGGDTADPAADADGDGYDALSDCDDGDAAVYPGAAEGCDGVDSDCDGTTNDADATDAKTWYYDADNDLYGDPATPFTGCSRPYRYRTNSLDCDDSNAATRPKGAESCADAVDSDCDGTLNDADATDAKTWWYDADYDFYGDPDEPFTGCSRPVRYRTNDLDCDDTDPAIKPKAPEVADGVDNDCDGSTDEGFDSDGDGYDGLSDCDDDDAAANPGAAETCDGMDNDCDGTIDVDAADAQTWYYDADNDLYGDPATSYTGCSRPYRYRANSLDCDDASAATRPGAAEVPDGVDNDCDGMVDEA